MDYYCQTEGATDGSSSEPVPRQIYATYIYMITLHITKHFFLLGIGMYFLLVKLKLYGIC